MSKLNDMFRRGPFVNDDGDVWVPVGPGGISKAYQIARDAGERYRFVGMDEARMSIHEDVWGHSDGIDEDGDEDAAIEACDESEPGHPCTWTGRAYHFKALDW